VRVSDREWYLRWLIGSFAAIVAACAIVWEAAWPAPAAYPLSLALAVPSILAALNFPRGGCT
jgi:hypothetical protein